MHLILLILGLAGLLYASIRKPLVGVLAMVGALQVEFLFLGQLPAGLTVGRAVGAFAMAGWLVNRQGFRKSILLSTGALAVPVFLFLAVVVIGALFAVDFPTAISEAIRVAMLLALCIMVGDTIASRRDLLALCWTIVLAAAVGAAAAVMQYNAYQAGGEVFGGIYETRQGVRFQGLSESANTLGIQLISGVPFLFPLFFTSRRKWVRAVCIGLLGLMAFALVLTVSRSNIYPLAVYIGVTYLLHRRMGKPLVAENVIVAVGALMLALALLNSSDYVRDRIARPIVDPESDTSLEARKGVLEQGTEVMLIRPSVGVGLVNTRNYFMLLGAHDTFSALLGETGLLGTAFFAAFCAGILRRQIGLVRRARLTADPLLLELAVSLVGALAILAFWLPAKVVFYQRLFWMWCGLVVWMDARLPSIFAGAWLPGMADRNAWPLAAPPPVPGFPEPAAADPWVARKT